MEPVFYGNAKTFKLNENSQKQYLTALEYLFQEKEKIYPLLGWHTDVVT